VRSRLGGIRASSSNTFGACSLVGALLVGGCHLPGEYNDSCTPGEYCPTPVVATYDVLNGVWGTGSSDVWAVGSGGKILHWNGSQWSSHQQRRRPHAPQPSRRSPACPSHPLPISWRQNHEREAHVLLRRRVLLPPTRSRRSRPYPLLRAARCVRLRRRRGWPSRGALRPTLQATAVTGGEAACKRERERQRIRERFRRAQRRQKAARKAQRGRRRPER
jgi:hypothetical protein